MAESSRRSSELTDAKGFRRKCSVEQSKIPKLENSGVDEDEDGTKVLPVAGKLIWNYKVSFLLRDF